MFKMDYLAVQGGHHMPAVTRTQKTARRATSLPSTANREKRVGRPKAEAKLVPLATSVPPYIKEWLQKMAEADRRTVSSYVNIILEDVYRKSQETSDSREY
jgi:hypothetical protein